MHSKLKLILFSLSMIFCGSQLNAAVPIINRPIYVDLGLSVNWATCNLGASNPEDLGDYFAWGETMPKDKYLRETYKFYEYETYRGERINVYHVSKYCIYKFLDNVFDNLGILISDDDAAYFQYGQGWHVPTLKEWKELYDNCVFTKTQKNGISGYNIKSKINGNSIFLPFCGIANDYKDEHVSYSCSAYWSSELYTGNFPNSNQPFNEDSEHATEICFYYSEKIQSDKIVIGEACQRWAGLPIRPVYNGNSQSVNLSMSNSSSVDNNYIVKGLYNLNLEPFPVEVEVEFYKGYITVLDQRYEFDHVEGVYSIYSAPNELGGRLLYYVDFDYNMKQVQEILSLSGTGYKTTTMERVGEILNPNISSSSNNADINNRNIQQAPQSSKVKEVHYKEKCWNCQGKKRIIKYINVSNLGAWDKKWCSECNSYYTPSTAHIHQDCPICHGTGYVDKVTYETVRQ